jgi:uncharacterized membrane protein YfcA
MLDILRNTPNWVYSVYAIVLYFGLSAMFPSKVNRKNLLIYFIINVGGVFYYWSYGEKSLERLAIFGIALTISCGLGYLNNIRIPPSATNLALEIEIPGECVTFFVLIGYFLTRFYLGYCAAVDSFACKSGGNLVIEVTSVGILAGFLFGQIIGRLQFISHETKRAVTSQ